MDQSLCDNFTDLCSATSELMKRIADSPNLKLAMDQLRTEVEIISDKLEALINQMLLPIQEQLEDIIAAVAAVLGKLKRKCRYRSESTKKHKGICHPHMPSSEIIARERSPPAKLLTGLNGEHKKSIFLQTQISAAASSPEGCRCIKRISMNNDDEIEKLIKEIIDRPYGETPQYMFGRKNDKKRCFMRTIEAALDESMNEQCEECHTYHNPLLPHDPTNPYYKESFFKKYGRYPTWNDAMEHCPAAVQVMVRRALKECGYDTASDNHD